MDTSTTARRPTCFFNKNDESHNSLIHSKPLYLPRRTSLKNLSSSSLIMSSPRSVCVMRRLYDTRFEDPQPHFLDACVLCKKPLGQNRDIFMYRGDTPFCSEECRQEQIEMDESNDKKLKLSALRKKDQKKSTSSNNTQNYPFSRGTVAAA